MFDRSMAVARERLRLVLKQLLFGSLDAVAELLLLARPSLRTELARRTRARPAGAQRCFSEQELASIAALAALIVPSGDEAPGAADIDVLGAPAARTIETLVAGSASLERLYRRGLVALDALACATHGAGFAALDPPRQKRVLETVVGWHEHRSDWSLGPLRGRPALHLLRVFEMARGRGPAIELYPQLREDVLKAFYTSEVAAVWLGYDGPPMPLGYADLEVPRARRRVPQAPAPRAPRPASIPRTDAADVVVIGCGAGGSVVTHALAEAGVRVVVLESGPRFDPHTDYLTDRADFELVASRVFEPRDPRRDHYTVRGERGFAYNRVKGVGGSTLHYEAMTPRLHESDFRTRSEDGVGEDWPLSYAELEPWYARVEQVLGVSGPDGANPFEPPRSTAFPNPPLPLNLAGQRIRQGAERLGSHFVREPLAIPSRDWNGRPACVGAGTCQLGCLISAKSSMDVSFVPLAEATGRAEIRPDSTATEIELDAGGRAKAVVYIDAQGCRQRLQARAVVLAADAVETPRLLLLNSSSRFPHGLANSSGLVGRNFTEHLAVFAHGVFAERLDAWRGTPTMGMIQDRYATRAGSGFARGWTLVVFNNSPWPYHTARRIAGWGDAHKRRMQQLFGHQVSVASIGEQLPDLHNRVDLDPLARDCHGLPVARLYNRPGRNDQAMIDAIRTDIAALLEAAGAREILGNEYEPGGSSHYFGTCRMGSDPASSVVDAWGRAHDVPNLFIGDGSVMVTGGAVNPALTIAALAMRTAHGIANAFARRDL